MKYLQFLFFLVTTFVGAQNYNYGLDQKPTDSENNLLDVSEGKNLPEEILYFDSYLLTSDRAYELQEALDTYGSVRLEKGSYPGPSIVMKTDQSLFGHPSNTKIPDIIVKAGSKNVRIQNVDSDITFEPGDEIENCIVKNVRFTPLSCTNCRLSNNTFINIERSKLYWDCSISGYFRNNKFIKHWIQASWPQIVMKGNTNTPSYGNITVWLNLLSPGGHAAELENIQTLTWLGIDAESWNWNNSSNKALIYAKEMGVMNLVGFTGGTNSSNKSPVFDIEADVLKIQSKSITSNGGKKSIIRGNTNLFTVSDKSEGHHIENNQFSYAFEAHLNGINSYLNEQPIVSTISQEFTDKLGNNIIGHEYKPWKRGEFEELAQPILTNWKEERKNQTDQSAYIQNLVDTHGIAELDEGIYYIGETITLDDEQGIVGKGTGKTVLVGLTDDLALVTATGNTSSVNFTLANLTLQGGKKGLHIRAKNDQKLQVTVCDFKFLVFRDQEKGIHLDKFYGFDNNFFDHVSFVNCGIGIFQEIDPSYSTGENASMMYVDKVVFYESQFINCEVGVSMMAGRTDNLIAWVNCKFEGNKIAADLRYHKGSFFANCDFLNHTGDYIIGESPIGVYSCRFKDNNSNYIFKSRDVIMEGSTVIDNISLFEKNKTRRAFILNSNIRGGLGRLDNGMLINSVIGNDQTISKRLIDFKEGLKKVLIDGRSNPYPQLLVTQ